jgi:hypothetical protein
LTEAAGKGSVLGMQEGWLRSAVRKSQPFGALQPFPACSDLAGQLIPFIDCFDMPC